jgi:hypothetical protein
VRQFPERQRRRAKLAGRAAGHFGEAIEHGARVFASQSHCGAHEVHDRPTERVRGQGVAKRLTGKRPGHDGYLERCRAAKHQLTGQAPAASKLFGRQVIVIGTRRRDLSFHQPDATVAADPLRPARLLDEDSRSRRREVERHRA